MHMLCPEVRHALNFPLVCQLCTRTELPGYKSCLSLSTCAEKALACLYIFIWHVTVLLFSLLLARAK